MQKHKKKVSAKREGLKKGAHCYTGECFGKNEPTTNTLYTGEEVPAGSEWD